MNKILTVLSLLLVSVSADAQRVLNLDSCRSLAMQGNRELRVAGLKREVAANTRKVARTKYLPKVNGVGAYQLQSREVSLLNSSQKEALNNLGTTMVSGLGSNLNTMLGEMVKQGLVSPQQASALGQTLNASMPTFAAALNGAGTAVRQAFRTNNRNMIEVAVTVTQPIYMGGAITAANRMADINERMAEAQHDAALQNTLADIDEAYWLVVSLNHKRKLADQYLQLVEKLHVDVNKMIKQGVATRADGLKVSVKVNEAEMSKTQADDGYALAKMLLCQLCGLPLDEDIMLVDEVSDNLFFVDVTGIKATAEEAWANRAEIKLLENAVSMSEQATRLTRATMLPQIGLTGGYLATNPNVYDGYHNRFGGVWFVGVMLNVPIWNWNETNYKVRAGKAATAIANLELAEAREKIELQVSQCRFRVGEAGKKLTMASRNVDKAEENLRCANVGFREGVMQSTEVLEAQTAWLQAQSQKIDAQIDVRLSQVGLRKALGILR